jgi:enamine deaminase RidA (YjgF/YER057c/UK114 family)
MTITRIEVGPRMSQAVVHGDVIYLAGQVADDTSADVAGQTHQILSKIERLLSAAGTDKSKLLTATIWLADIATFGEMNSVWDPWVAPGHPPARACVEAKLAAAKYKVEIGVIAAR